MVTSKGHAKIPTFHLASQVGFDAAGGEQTLHDYDSPEEARGEQADDRSDIYSVGAVLYEMLTTRRPHHRGASAPSVANPRVPPELDAVAPQGVVAESGVAISECRGPGRRAAVHRRRCSTHATFPTTTTRLAAPVASSCR